MPRVTIRDVGSIGVVLDRPGHELPPEAWTRVQNISFYDNGAARSRGEFDVFGTPTIEPHYLFPSPSSETAFWVYTDTNKVHCVTGLVHTDITRLAGDYVGGTFDRWNGGWINGVLVLNNGLDDPQQWMPISPATKLIVLSNWPANTKARVIREFQNFLFALNVTEVGVNYPTKIRWSHPADPGTVPVTWDKTDATKLAGDLPLSQTPGAIVDGLALGSSFMVYKQDAVVRMDRILTNDVFTPRYISSTTGLMAQQCMVEFQPNKHLFFTLSGDVVVTDGVHIESVIDRVNQRSLEGRIDGDTRSRSFVVANLKAKEVYIAYPKSGSQYCNEMAVWNWKDSTWSFRELTPSLDAKSGIYSDSVANNTWNSNQTPWNVNTRPWNQRLSVTTEYKPIGAFPMVNRLRQIARGERLGTDVTYSSFLERLGLSLIGQARDGSPRNDPNVVKLITEVYPLFKNPTDVNISVFIGAQDRPQGPVTWAGPYAFNPSTMEKVDCYAEGRYIATRFECVDEIEWQLWGYGMKIDVVGEYL